MNSSIIFEEDVFINGMLSFYANKKYVVYSNGTSSLRREFIVSDITDRGEFIFSISSAYQVVK